MLYSMASPCASLCIGVKKELSSPVQENLHPRLSQLSLDAISKWMHLLSLVLQSYYENLFQYRKKVFYNSHLASKS